VAYPADGEFQVRIVLFCLFCTTAAEAQLPDRITIEQALQEATDRNLSLLAERYNLSVAEARVITARLRPNPVFTAGTDYIDFLGTFTPEQNVGPTEYNARVDYVWERGAKRERRIEVAQDAKEVASLQLANTLRSLRLDVENAFIDVLQAKDNLELARSNLTAFQGIVDINTTRVRSGDLAKIELVRTQVAALQFQNAVRQAESRLRVASNKLQTLMGRTYPSPTFDVAGSLRRDTTPLTVETVQTGALQMRPDLLALRRDQARSQAELRSQIAQGKVDFTISGMYHRQFYNGASNTLGFFFSAPIPVFNKNQGEIERASQEQRQIEARIRALESDVLNEARNAWVQYTTSRDLLESIERDLLTQAQDVRDTTEYSYRRGEASLVEFLDAQRAYNDARQSYNDARADYARSLYTIDSISGRSAQ
jgi:cobalt-zinc-cadmium efflux system outer membrane protein